MSSKRDSLFQFIADLHHIEKLKKSQLIFNQTKVRSMSIALSESITDFNNLTDDNKIMEKEIQRLKNLSADINNELLRIIQRKTQAITTHASINRSNWNWFSK